VHYEFLFNILSLQHTYREVFRTTGTQPKPNLWFVIAGPWASTLHIPGHTVCARRFPLFSPL
jgi:hypothetical protein